MATKLQSSLLYENPEKSIVLLDIPRSLEEAQVLVGENPTRRLITRDPITQPFTSPESKRKHAGAHSITEASPALQIENLMTTADIENALAELKNHYRGPFVLPRVTDLTDLKDDLSIQANEPRVYLPPQSRYVCAPVEQVYESNTAIQDPTWRNDTRYGLIVMDPPWPSRSVMRNRQSSYRIPTSMAGAKDILSHLPISAQTADDALVAIWVTNKEAVLSYVRDERRTLNAWGLEYVTTWTWVKITTDGEPIFPLESEWRKPWEKLIIARKRGTDKWKSLGPRIIFAAPDFPSRKPSPRRLFQDLIGPEVKALELFARNLTAGWSSVGDEVLKFQHRDCWVQT